MDTYRIGDKVLIEVEVAGPETMSTVLLSLGQNLPTFAWMKKAIRGHEPKLIPPAAGQVWSDRGQEYHHYVKAVFDGFVVFMNSTSNQPQMLTIGQFQKSRRYVSG